MHVLIPNNSLSTILNYLPVVLIPLLITQIPQGMAESNLTKSTMTFERYFLDNLKSVSINYYSMNSFSVYENKDYGLIMKLPESWKASKMDEYFSAHDLNVVRFVLSDNETKTHLPSFDLIIDELPGASNLSEYTNNRINAYKNSSINVLVNVVKEQINLAGHPAYKFIGTRIDPETGLNIMSLEVGTLIAGKGYILRYSMSSDLFSKYLQQVGEMAKSFRIIGHPL